MATPYHILVPASDTGLLHVKQDDETAAKVSELLQEDLEKHHVFFNVSGFHNHIMHQLLALYGTGATKDTIQKGYDANKSYQLVLRDANETIIQELRSDWPANAPKYLGLGKHYASFLKFFQEEIDSHGWEAVIKEFLCEDTPKSIDAVQRLFSGLVHPMIQLMYGIEWEQPAIIATGLAQTCVHKNPLGDFFSKTDEAVAKIDQSGVKPAKMRPIPEYFETIRQNEKLATAAKYSDDQRLYDGVLGRAMTESVALAATIRVSEDELEERTAEILHNNAYVATAASLNPPYIPKFDFFLVHSLNSTLFLFSFNKHAWIPSWAKTRLLEHKIRYDLFQYIARGNPLLSIDAIKKYAPPEDTLVSDPKELLPRFHDIVDDGHLIKVVRALLVAQEESRKWVGRPWIRFDDDEAWLKAHYLLMRSAEGQSTLWVRSAGFKEAWEEFPKLTAHSADTSRL